MKIFRNSVDSSTNIASSSKDYKQSIKEILSSSSLAYLLSPIRSKRLLIKIIYIIFLNSFFIASIYYVMLNILDYLKYETTTSIYKINEIETEFLTVSFCMKNEKKFKLNILLFWFQNEDLIEEWQNHFESYQDTVYGSCYRFNSGKNISNQSIPIKKVKKSGLDEGFWLNFYFKSNSDFDHLMIYFHNNTQIPATIYNKGYFISSGSFFYFNNKRIYDQKLELPFNDCYKNVSNTEFNQTIIDYMINKKIEYTQIDCLYFCRNLRFNEISGCNFKLNNLEEDLASKLSNKNECVQEFIEKINNNKVDCSNYCPLECDSFTYETNTHLVMLPSQGNISLNSRFSEFNTYENVSKTLFALRVYYHDLKFTLISQEPKIELFGLISNVGGTLGLFLGFSFISLLELLEILAELVYIKFY